MKIHLLLLLFGALAFTTACGDDDDDLLTDDSSATLTIDNVIYEKAEDVVVNFVEFSVNDEDFFQINGTVANGTDSVDFSVNIPNFQSGTYSKTTSSDEEVNITVSLDLFDNYSTNPFVFDPADDVSTYELNIVASGSDRVSGDFTGTLMNGQGQTISVTGEFVAIDFLSNFFGQ